MRVHVLAGCCELLEPQVLDAEAAQNLIGPSVRTASAAWLSPAPDSRYHSALQDGPGDCRTTTMALALNEEFGNRFEPLLVLSQLMDEAAGNARLPRGKRSQRAVLSEIRTRGRLRELKLYGLALPDEADPESSWAAPAGIVASAVRDRIEKLRKASMKEAPSEVVETMVIEVTPGLPAFSVLYGNAVCNQIAARLLPRLRSHGWSSDATVLPRAVAGILRDWSKKGIAPGLPLRAEDLDDMTNLVFEKLF